MFLTMEDIFLFSIGSCTYYYIQQTIPLSPCIEQPYSHKRNSAAPHLKSQLKIEEKFEIIWKLNCHPEPITIVQKNTRCTWSIASPFVHKFFFCIFCTWFLYYTFSKHLWKGRIQKWFTYGEKMLCYIFIFRFMNEFLSYLFINFMKKYYIKIIYKGLKKSCI